MAGFCSWLCNLLSGKSGSGGSNDALKTKLADGEQGVELGGMKTARKEDDKQASAKPKQRSKGSLMFAKRKEAEAVKKAEEPTCAPTIETLPPIISLPIESLEKGTWQVKGLYSHQVLIIGLRYLDDNWNDDALLDFPRRPNGTSLLLREKVIKDLVTGAAKVKSLPAGDIQAAQGDLKHLSMRQLLRLRVLHLDFAPGSASANNINTVGETSAAFIVKVDLLLFQLLGRHATKDLLADASNKHLVEKIDSVCGVLGHELTLIAAVAASISESPWWAWWIDEHRVFFNAARFSCAKAFPDNVLEIADSSSPDGNGRTWFAWSVRSVTSESKLGAARARAVSGPDSAKSGASGTAKAGSPKAGPPGISADLLANARGGLKKTKTPDTNGD